MNNEYREDQSDIPKEKMADAKIPLNLPSMRSCRFSITMQHDE